VTPGSGRSKKDGFFLDKPVGSEDFFLDRYAEEVAQEKFEPD
jgi:hypothetical protein